MQRDSWNNTRQAWAGSSTPVTIGLMVAQFIGLIIYVGMPTWVDHVAFVAPEMIREPWTLLTYAFLPGGESRYIFWNFLFKAGMTFWMCGSLERSWGSRNFTIFYLINSVVSALFILLGSVITSSHVPADDLIPVLNSGVVWGVLNAGEMVSIMFLTIPGRFISLIAVFTILFEYARPAGLHMIPWTAVPFALGGSALAYAWAIKGCPFSIRETRGYGQRPAARPNLRLVPQGSGKAPRPKDDRFTLRDLNPLEWFAKRRRRKQFERLMGDD